VETDDVVTESLDEVKARKVREYLNKLKSDQMDDGDEDEEKIALKLKDDEVCETSAKCWHAAGSVRSLEASPRSIYIEQCGYE